MAAGARRQQMEKGSERGSVKGERDGAGVAPATVKAAAPILAPPTNPWGVKCVSSTRQVAAGGQEGGGESALGGGSLMQQDGDTFPALAAAAASAKARSSAGNKPEHASKGGWRRETSALKGVAAPTSAGDADVSDGNEGVGGEVSALRSRRGRWAEVAAAGSSDRSQVCRHVCMRVLVKGCLSEACRPSDLSFPLHLSPRTLHPPPAFLLLPPSSCLPPPASLLLPPSSCLPPPAIGTERAVRDLLLFRPCPQGGRRQRCDRCGSIPT